MTDTNRKHQEHIACIPASFFKERVCGLFKGMPSAGDIVIKQRFLLEGDDSYRQIIPAAVFMYEGMVWAYRRTKVSGEQRLFSKVAVAVGGHLDAPDVAYEDGVIDLDKTLYDALERELSEEILLESEIVKVEELDVLITADDTSVDREHVGFIKLYHLDGDMLKENEDKLKGLGFISPSDLLDESNEYDLEAWTRIICEYLIS